MLYSPKLGAGALFLCLLATSSTRLVAQQSAPTHPPDYPGVHTRIPGVFVTPVPGAPFSGTVEILSKQSLPDGTVYTRRTVNHIARSSSGVIYNELRKLEPPDFQGEPPLMRSHIYDPQTRLNTYLHPQTHIARQILRSAPQPPANSTPASAVPPPHAQNLTTQDLGTETVAGLVLRGTRKQRTVPANLSGTGQEVTIIDDYWYSEDLKVYLVLKHNDPRTGEQFVGIVNVDRREPAASIFQIPSTFKIVDETPVQAPQP
jgi:hypothetical protein